MQLLKISHIIEMARGGLSGNGQAHPAEFFYAKNTSGGALARGDVVVWDRTNTTVDIICVTTTTGANDIDVVGMIYDLSVASNAIGRVQNFGPTKSLKVDGTTDIAVGDMLGTFTTAKIAAKSTTGGRFARATEAYTTNDSLGVIDAFICCRNFGTFTTE